MTAPLADIAGNETLAGLDASLAELDRRLGREDVTPVAGPDAVWPRPGDSAPDVGVHQHPNGFRLPPE